MYFLPFVLSLACLSRSPSRSLYRFLPRALTFLFSLLSLSFFLSPASLLFPPSFSCSASKHKTTTTQQQQQHQRHHEHTESELRIRAPSMKYFEVRTRLPDKYVRLSWQGISDPGMELAEACAAEGVRVVPVPGACAAVAAISVSGFESHEFVFFGFVSGKRGSAVRRRKLEEIARVRKIRAGAFCTYYCVICVRVSSVTNENNRKHRDKKYRFVTFVNWRYVIFVQNPKPRLFFLSRISYLS